MTIDYRVGDTRDLIAQLPDGSVDLIASSPPFLALRSYLPADHHAKHAEIGSEPDPATFIDTLLGLTAEWGRVLAPHGSIAIELGDTYAGSGGAGGDYNAGGLREGQNTFTGSNRAGKNGRHSMVENAPGGHHMGGAGWPRAKSLALIPQLYAIALAYGRNPLTGRESPAGQWLVRNVIVWHRPNPAPGALGDKYRPSTSYIVVATRSPKRWFDLTAVRTPYEHGMLPPRGGSAMVAGQPRGQAVNLIAGAPPLDCWLDHHDTWTITTQPSRLAHYAMWPAKIAERLILSMCPAEVCVECGEPRRRVERTVNAVGFTVQRRAHRLGREGVADINLAPDRSERETLGWTDCGHNNYRPGVTLDPFAGAGTTPIVAHLHNRTGIGFDLDPRNHNLVPARTDEVRRNLFGTKPETPGQLDLFQEAAS